MVSVCMRGNNYNSDTRLQNAQNTEILYVKELNLPRQITMTWTPPRCHDVFQQSEAVVATPYIKKTRLFVRPQDQEHTSILNYTKISSDTHRQITAGFNMARETGITSFNK